jgi:hypothetical protein
VLLVCPAGLQALLHLPVAPNPETDLRQTSPPPVVQVCLLHAASPRRVLTLGCRSPASPTALGMLTAGLQWEQDNGSSVFMLNNYRSFVFSVLRQLQVNIQLQSERLAMETNCRLPASMEVVCSNAIVDIHATNQLQTDCILSIM